MGWRNDWGVGGGFMWRWVEFGTRDSLLFTHVCGVVSYFMNDKWHKNACSKHNSSYVETTADFICSLVNRLHQEHLAKKTPVGTKHRFTPQNIYKAILIELKHVTFAVSTNPSYHSFGDSIS
jgi:hypothetical protein